jgi:hypothetical protein
MAIIHTSKKKLGWYRLGGFEKDPFLTEKDKRYYREDREYRRVKEAYDKKESNWLGRWIEKFSVEGDFWSKEKKPKIKKDDYL